MLMMLNFPPSIAIVAIHVIFFSAKLERKQTEGRKCENSRSFFYTWLFKKDMQVRGCITLLNIGCKNKVKNFRCVANLCSVQFNVLMAWKLVPYKYKYFRRKLFYLKYLGVMIYFYDCRNHCAGSRYWCTRWGSIVYTVHPRIEQNLFLLLVKLLLCYVFLLPHPGQSLNGEYLHFVKFSLIRF